MSKYDKKYELKLQEAARKKKESQCSHSSVRHELEWVAYVKICNICDKTLGLNDVKYS